MLGGKYCKPDASKNSKELSIENKSIALGRRQGNIINIEIGHAWAVEWMRLAGCSLYTYTVCI
jgi:hypothetical protein